MIRPKEEYEADVVRASRENHMWLNAANCINPTDEFLRRVGSQVVDSLIDAEISLLPGGCGKVLILRVSKS